MGRQDYETETLIPVGGSFDVSVFDPNQITSKTNASVPKPGLCHTLPATENSPVAFAQNTRDEVREMDVVGALAAEPGMKQTSYLRQDMSVRRLTPRECARLQGFPDDYLDIPYNGKPAKDGPKYKALGNSMAVNCMRWIGTRIQLVEDTLGPVPPKGE